MGFTEERIGQQSTSNDRIRKGDLISLIVRLVRLRYDFLFDVSSTDTSDATNRSTTTVPKGQGHDAV